MKKLTNEQKLAFGVTIFGVCLLLSLLIFPDIMLNKSIKVMKLGGVTINAIDYNNLQSKFPNFVFARICSLEENNHDCIQLINIDNYIKAKESVNKLQTLPSSSETSAGGGEIR
jgi:hypothetical protein